MNNQLYRLIPEPAGEWQEGDRKVWTCCLDGKPHRARPIPTYSGQLWRDLDENEDQKRGDRQIQLLNFDWIWQRPVPATCGPISVATEPSHDSKGGDSVVGKGHGPGLEAQPGSKQSTETEQPAENVVAQNICQGCEGLREALQDVRNYFSEQGTGRVFHLGYYHDRERECRLNAALAATPCQSSGKTDPEEEQPYTKTIHDWAAHDGLWSTQEEVTKSLKVFAKQVLKQAAADRDQWKERAHELRDCRGLFDLKEGQSLLYAIETLKVAQSTGWISLDQRKPTEADSDDLGLVRVRWEDGARTQVGWDYTPFGITHWHPLPKFTPDPDPDEAAFEKWWEGEHPFMHRDGAKAAFEAGLVARQKETK